MESYKLNQDTYLVYFLVCYQSPNFILSSKKQNTKRREYRCENCHLLFIWIGISSLLMLVAGSSALTLGSLITALVYIVICAASGQNRVFGIELPSTFVDYLSNNSLASKRDLEDYNEFVTSTTSKIPLAIGLIMGILVTFVIEYLLYILKYLIAINNLSG